MSIRFGWTRPQAQPETSDEDRVENVSSAVSEAGTEPAPDAPGPDRARMPERDEHVSGDRDPGAEIPTGQIPIGTPVTTPTPEAVRSIWEVHARVIETERKSHRRIGAAAARRAYHEALVEEAAALHALGFESFDSFTAVHGATAPADGETTTTDESTIVAAHAPAETAADPETGSLTEASAASDDEPESAGETIGRIRMLLDELGIEPGGDPLQAAKQFLDVVEGDTSAPDGDESHAPSDEADALGAAVVEIARADSPVAEVTPAPEEITAPRHESIFPITPIDASTSDQGVDDVGRQEVATPSDTIMPSAHTAAPTTPPIFPAPPSPATDLPTDLFASPDEPGEVRGPAAASEVPETKTTPRSETHLAETTPPEPAPTLVIDEEAIELAHARAERWHAELERVRIEFTAATEAHEAAERDTGLARQELERLRSELELTHEAARTADAEIVQRTSEHDDAAERCTELAEEIARLREESTGSRSEAETRERERDEMAERLAAAHTQLEEIQAQLTDAEAKRARLDTELADAHRRAAEHEATREQLAVHVADLERAVAENADHAASFEATAAELRTQVQDREATLAELRDRVGQLEGAVSERDNTIVAHEQALSDATAARRRTRIYDHRTRRHPRGARAGAHVRDRSRRRSAGSRRGPHARARREERRARRRPISCRGTRAPHRPPGIGVGAARDRPPGCAPRTRGNAQPRQRARRARAAHPGRP